MDRRSDVSGFQGSGIGEKRQEIFPLPEVPIRENLDVGSQKPLIS
jgi:hypothetical protein